MIDLAEIKKKHRLVYIVQIGSYQIPIRPLTWREHDIYLKVSLLGVASPGKIEDVLFREVVLDPALIEVMNQLPAGIISSIAGLVMYMSGFSMIGEDDVDRLNQSLDTARAQLESNIFEQLISIVCSAFPNMTPYEIEDLPFSEVTRLVAMAEKKLGVEEPVKIQKKKKAVSPADEFMQDNKKFRRADSNPRRSLSGPPSEDGPISVEEQRERARQLHNEVARRVLEKRKGF